MPREVCCDAAERNGMLTFTLIKVAAAFHRTHSRPSDAARPSCTHRICTLATRALNGATERELVQLAIDDREARQANKILRMG